MGLKDPKALSEYSGFAVSTLAKKRLDGSGPPYIKIGAKVLYPTDDFNRWVESFPRVRSTADSDDHRGQKAVETRRLRAAEGEAA